MKKIKAIIQSIELKLWKKFTRHIQGFIGKKLMMVARYFIGKSLKYCWICGRNPGMGLINSSGHWCQSCESEWLYFHRPQDGIVVDWIGLGRRVK